MHRRAALRAAGAAVAGGALPAFASAADAASGAAQPTDSDRRSQASTRATFGPRSRLSLPGAKEAVLDDAGETAFVATTDGFATVDVTDPEAPSVLADRRDLLADREDGPMRRLQDAAVDGDRLAVVGPASGSGLSGALVYDVADPADPRRLAFHETEFPIHNCDLSGGHVYLTSTPFQRNALVAVDVRGDATEEAWRWSMLDADPDWEAVPDSSRTLHDVTVVDGVAYCAYWDARTWLLDVEPSDGPRLLGRAGGYDVEDLESMSPTDLSYEDIEPPGNAHFADVSDDGSVLAVGGESWDGRRGDGHGGPSGIELYDVADPAEPELLSRVQPLVPRDATFREGVWTTAHNFELTGGRLYSSWYQDGVKIHDVSDPTTPELLAHWRDPEETRFWTARLARDGEFFVATDMGGRGEAPEDAALYTFPDAAGSQSEMPAIETATPSPNGTATGTRTATGTATERSPTATPTLHEPTESPTTDVTTPGVGALGALAGLGVAAWRRLRAGE